ncbi:MAG TPA: OmpA family protein [Anseongella sp.]|nr:OmpA family protein [Anseongella sp.]
MELRRELPGAQVERARGGIKVTFASGILFPVNAASLSPEAQLHIAKLAEILNRFPETRILVEGHTDITGTTEYNKVLSEKRAASVKEYAVTLGVDPARVGTAGHGEARPVATNSTEKGREKNRRVEVFILVTD